MKKILSFSLALLLPLLAGAQAFNHLSIGLGAGTDGASLEAAAPIGSHFELRAGYGTALGLLGYTFQGAELPEHPGSLSSSRVKVPMSIKLGMSDARLLFNIYPSATGSFHFTVGAFMGAQRFARAVVTGLPGDYNTAGIEVDNYLVRASSGELQAYLGAPGFGAPGFAVKPYVGIGFGRAVNPDRRVNFVFDLGAQYQGTPGIWASGEGLTGGVKDVQIPADALGDISAYVDEYASWLTFWPTLTCHLYINLF